MKWLVSRPLNTTYETAAENGVAGAAPLNTPDTCQMPVATSSHSTHSPSVTEPVLVRSRVIVSAVVPAANPNIFTVARSESRHRMIPRITSVVVTWILWLTEVASTPTRKRYLLPVPVAAGNVHTLPAS